MKCALCETGRVTTFPISHWLMVGKRGNTVKNVWGGAIF